MSNIVFIALPLLLFCLSPVTAQNRKPLIADPNRDKVSDTIKYNQESRVFDVDEQACNEFGKVVLEIVVDKNGNVLEAELMDATTNNSECLVKIAKAQALKTKFSADEKAPEKQKGKIVYEFKPKE